MTQKFDDLVRVSEDLELLHVALAIRLGNSRKASSRGPLTDEPPPILS